MKNKHGVFLQRVAALLYLGLLFSYPTITLSQSNPWLRIPIDEGGVGEDVQLLRRSDNAIGDTVWSANMEAGLFRATWNGSNWSTWTEFLPGRGMLGIDVIRVSGTEYVLAAGAGTGLWYMEAPPLNLGNWPRPNENDYPSTWHDARTQDASFYCQTNNQYPTYPQTQYFIILSSVVDPDQNPQTPNYNPGIYRWDVDLTPDNFTRVDAVNYYDEQREFRHFWRDLEDANVIYATLREGENYEGGLYRFSGDYDQPSPSFTYVDITDNSVPPYSYDIKDALGFNQWRTTGQVPNITYSYFLAKWNDGLDDKYSVFVLSELELGDPQLEGIWDIENTYFAQGYEDWTPFDVRYPGQVVGKPAVAGNHKLWVATNAQYGVLYMETSAGGSEGLINVGLKTYDHRAFTPDPNHIPAGYDMALLMGTHKQGVWRLTFDDLSTYSWTHQKDGYHAIDIRLDFDLLPNGATPEILVPGWCSGMFKYTGNQWVELGTSGSPGIQTDPAFDRQIHGIAKFGDDIYFGSGSWGENGPDVTIANTNYYLGGLYKINISTNTTLAESFGVPGDQYQYTVYNLVSASQNEVDYLYLTTGTVGPGEDPGFGSTHYICRKSTSSAWSTLYTMTDTDYSYLAVMDLDPCPFLPADTVYLALGNLYGWTGEYPPQNPFYGRVERLYNSGSPTWDIDNSWTWTAPTDHSVLDIEAINDPQNPGNALTFWSTSALGDPGSAATGQSTGCVYKRRLNAAQPTPLYDTSGQVTLDGITFQEPPAATRLACFTEGVGGPVVLIAALCGRTNASDLSYEGHIYQYRDQVDRWYRLYTQPLVSAVPFPLPAFDIEVDLANGCDIYVGSNSGVFKLDNLFPTIPTPPTIWNWVSYNCVDPEDTLKYLFAGADSLEEIRDQYGKRFRPNDNPPIDSVYVWNWLKSYGVRTYVSDTLSALGPQIPFDSSMTLYPECPEFRYNWIAYLPDDTMAVDYAFSATDCVQIVKNDDGEFWRPSEEDPPFDMYPGEGYQVGVSDTITHQYPAPPGQSSSPPPGDKNSASPIAGLTPQHFQFAKKTGDFYAIYIEDLLVNGGPPEPSDEVGCFTPTGLCVGAAVYEGSFPIKIAAWKDDPCTEEVDGYASGETLSFKFFDASAGLEIPLEMVAIGLAVGMGNPFAATKFEQGFYAQQILQGSYILPGSYNLAQNFPNPFNSTTTIRYDLPFESIVKLEIFDLLGRKVATLLDGKQTAGFRAVRWDGRNDFGGLISSGVYFYRLKADATYTYLGKKDSYVKTHKMVLIK